MDCMGQFDETLTHYTTSKGVTMVDNLTASPFTNVQIKTPAYIPASVIAPPEIREIIANVLLTNIAQNRYTFKTTQQLKSFRGSYWLYTYYSLLDSGQISQLDGRVVLALQAKATRSGSGIINNTICLSPYPYGREAGDGDFQLNAFSCKYNCSFCPNQPGVPRSYLASETAVLRGITFQYHPVFQTFSRLATLFYMGHPIDKVEVRFIGGTWNSYNPLYRKWVIWKTFEAHNNFFSRTYEFAADRSEFILDRFTHEQLDELIAREQKINESADCRIIGLTIETRPDCINRPELKMLRQFGCTRVEMGLQHTNDDVLRINNRGHLVSHSKRAIKLLKDHGFKILIHLMPQLPGSNPEMDIKMLMDVINEEDLQADEWKLYNCEVLPYTQIQKWYEDGTYKPYSEEELRRVYMETLPHMPEYVRIDRVKRDFPSGYTLAGISDGGFRNKVFDDLAGSCYEIRNREIKDGIVTSWNISQINYASSGGQEYFLMIKNQDNLLCGFCRLRLPNRGQRLMLKELEQLRLDGGVALIRELHVYGKLSPVNSPATNSQHRGFGQTLVRTAENIANAAGYKHMAIIAGIGTRLYYHNKLGYNQVGGTYMIKTIATPNRCYNTLLIMTCILIPVIIAHQTIKWLLQLNK